MLINVFDFLDAQGKPDLQAALDAAQDGDAIYLPGARVYQAPAGGWIIRKRIELFGDGPGKKDSYLGTVLVPAGMNDPVLVLDAPDGTSLPNLYLHDFQISRPQGQSVRYGGAGVLYNPGSEKKVSNLMIERVTVYHLKGTAFSLLGANGDKGAIVGVHMLDCAAEDCGGYGLDLAFGFVVNLMHCHFRSNGKSGCRSVEGRLALYQCSFDNNDAEGTEGSLVFVDSPTARVEACTFTGFAVGAAKTACSCSSSPSIIGVGGGFVIGGCRFEVPVGAGACTGIHVESLKPENGPVLILPNRFLRVTTLVDAQDIPGRFVLPQYDESDSGSIALAGSPNQGLVASPHLNRPTGNQLSGLAIPAALAGEPTLNLEVGTLAWNNGLIAYLDGDWRTVETSS